MSRAVRNPVPAPDVGTGAQEEDLKLSDDELIAIGKRVREARDLKAMSQTALASSVGVGQNYVSRIEAGKRQLSLAILFRIADTLGQPVGWLAKDEGPGPVAQPRADWDQRDQRKRRNPGGK